MIVTSTASRAERPSGWRGEDFTTTFLAIKKAGCNRIFAAVSDVDVEWYPRNA
jgi:hypothetical protein